MGGRNGRAKSRDAIARRRGTRDEGGRTLSEEQQQQDTEAAELARQRATAWALSGADGPGSYDAMFAATVEPVTELAEGEA